MSNRLNADELLREAFEALNPFQGGSSDEADRKAALRENIARYLAGQGKPVARGGGGGGPAMFGGSEGHVTSVGYFGGSGPTVPGVYMADMHKQAMKLGRPVLTGGGGGGGTKGFGDWIFPDGHTERLPVGTEPIWQKDNHVRDAVRNNPD